MLQQVCSTSGELAGSGASIPGAATEAGVPRCEALAALLTGARAAVCGQDKRQAVTLCCGCPRDTVPLGCGAAPVQATSAGLAGERLSSAALSQSRLPQVLAGAVQGSSLSPLRGAKAISLQSAPGTWGKWAVRSCPLTCPVAVARFAHCNLWQTPGLPLVPRRTAVSSGSE